MEVNAIQAATGGIGETSSRQSLSQEDFLKIMISELANQDPLEPLENNEFLNQLTQMQTLEATNQLTRGITALMLGQQLTSAGVLIGRQVTGVGSDQQPVSGIVDRVLVEDGDVTLGLGSVRLPLESVREVSVAPVASTEQESNQ